VSSPTSADFALSGPSDPPDPLCHAYRKDLADIALAGRVIASHYAAPVDRMLGSSATLRTGPSGDSEMLAELQAGTKFEMLDDSRGWAWGYAGPDRLVGYVESGTLAAY
jgi:hypothetical protein